ncbi:hypothetical protein [Pseudooceanicola sp.]|uniref:hypothetical protein n=2 Tax=Pseudooceanicola sp. TaxID=1914328 RepID=UPI0035C67353
MTMIMDWRPGLAALALIGLAACQPPVPDSGAGVGFGDYAEYQRQREAQLSGRVAQSLPPASQISSEPLNATGGTQSAAADTPEAIAAQTRAALDAANGPADFTPGAATGEPLQASPSNPPPVAVNSVGISNENDFSAVDEQRSIAEDKALIERNRANYTQVQPEALPTRTDTGPNIVAYALQTTHNPGVSQYRRSNLPGVEGRFQRACAKYASPDLAQTDFLKSGGPERDRKGVDPDGDGFACQWDPRPFRKAAGG